MISKERTVKKVFSSLDLAVIVNELKGLILGSFVDNVYADIFGGLILKLSKSGEDSYLVIRPGEGLHTTENISKLESVGKVPLFRKYLNGLKISGIEQLEFDRVAVLTFGGRGDTYRLYVELIPRGVLTLTDLGDKVLVVDKEFKAKDREVIMGRKYVLPPMYKDFRKLGVDEWFEKLCSYNSLKQGLTRGLGVPPEIINEVLGDYLNTTVNRDLISEIRSKVIAFIEEVLRRPEPTIIVSKTIHEYVAFLTFRPSRLGDDLELLTFNSFNKAVDTYFLQLMSKNLMTKDLKVLDEELAKTDKLINDLKAELERLEKQLNELRSLHGVIAVNYDVLDSISKCVWNIVKTLGWEHVSICGITDYDKSRGIIRVIIDGNTVELSIRDSVKSYLIKLKAEIKDCEDKIVKVNEVLNNLLTKKNVLRREREEVVTPLIKRVDWYDKYHWIVTSDGFVSIGGRDAKQNEKLVRKYLTDDDIFMHADILGAPIFIIKCGGKRPSERALYEVATLAACYSRGWREGFRNLDVFWVYGKQVSKKAPAGEYLSMGSFMVYGERNYLRNVKLELAIGVTVYGDYYKLIVGPEDYVRGTCRIYAVLQPGNEGKESVAKKVIKYFVEREKRLKYLDINNIISRIPGPSKVVKLSAV